ncbi:bifunctional metallophosphatase/5'-nucleotidase [Tumebacillus flagellatus]|uniref:5'-nucleotidase n=1 Tax=Tumebacillus flagellatus TaxID=1157490 RepID=A0A074LWB4_9BACL|nr:bifunctional UDP-sugar hydrolase/5'-nucleotidase [Tumebacillus flagellatus]KEO84885.1 hypothetical protein EL26_02420 [Tumebacillus flagellatus]
MKRNLTILHTNDIHSNFAHELKLAGLLREKRNSLRAAGVPVLVVDGGDHLDISILECQATDGQLNLDLHAALGYHAAAVGNNELSRFTLEQIRGLSRASRVPWLLANVVEGDGSPIGGMQEALLLDLDGIKIGLTGITDQFGTFYEDALHVKNADTVTAVRTQAERLRAQGADLVVLLSHAGLNQDQELAPRLAGHVDLIIGAHTHDALHEPLHEAGVWIAQAGAMARFLGELTLELDLQAAPGQTITSLQGCLHPVEEDMLPDAELQQIYEDAQSVIEAKISEVLGVLETPVSHDELIAHLAAVMRDYYQAELGMMFGAVAVAGFPAGPLTVGDIYRNLMSLVNVTKFEFQGKQLLGLLHERNNPDIYNRHKIGGGVRPKEGLPVGKIQFDGLTWDERDREITNCRVNGEPLDPERWYTVGGGEHLGYADSLYYPSLEGSKILHVDDYTYVKDAYIAHIRNQRKEVTS